MNRSKPWWIAAAVIGVGGLWLYGASRLVLGSTYAKVGPGMFVTLVGGALIALGVLLAVQIARGERFEPQDAEGADSGQPTNRFAFWCALVGMGLPLVLMERVGFVLTATACFVAIAAAFGERRWLRMVLIGFIVAAAAWGAFSYLGVTLGPFATFKLN